MQSTFALRPTAAAAAGLVLLLAGVVHATPLDNAIEQVVQANLAAAKSQGKVDKLSDETNELVSQYRSTMEQLESLQVYNGQLQTLVDAQQEEVDSLRDQIDNVTTIARELTPLMARMLEALTQFVSLDVPFLKKERAERIAKLTAMMRRADVTNAEKYRRILEAYQIENDYGRTIEYYKGELKTAGETRTVNFLRIGRVALIYQTLDEKEAGVWDREAGKWMQLPNTYRTALRKGFRIARKQAAPDLLRVPVPAPRSAL
jgi:predicted RNase H-like nuclease (RuvC/YqgF family)